MAWVASGKLGRTLRMGAAAVGAAWALAVGPAFSVEFTKDQVAIHASDGRKHTFDVEVADSPDEHARGLMHRESLGRDQGMLFDFRPGRPVAMWMKNTLIPLDMLFADKSGRIVHIERDAEPGSLASRGPREPVTAVLEIRGGRSSELGIREGDRLDHPMFH